LLFALKKGAYQKNLTEIGKYRNSGETKKESKLTISHIQITGCCFLPDLTWLGNQMLYRTCSQNFFYAEGLEYSMKKTFKANKKRTIRH